MNATTDIFNDNQALFVVDDKCRTNYSLSYIMNITNDISAFFKLYSVLFKNKVICATKSFYEKNKKYMDNVNITTLDNLFNYIIDKIRPYYTIDTKIHIIDKKLIDVSFFADHYYFLSTSHSNEYQYKKILLMYKYYDKEYYNFLYSLFDYFKHTSPYIIVTTIDKSIPKDIHKMCLLLNSFRIKSDNIYNNKSRQMSNWLGTAADMNKYKLIKYLDRHEIDKGSFHETNEYFKTLKDPNKIIYATCLKNNIIARYNQQNNRFYKSTGG